MSLGSREQRVMCGGTVPVSVMDALTKRCAEEGENRSRLLEKALRLLLSMPVEIQDEEEKELTGKTALVLEVLTSLGPGPWSTVQVSLAGSGSMNLTLERLQALARLGKVHLWGHGGWTQVRQENGEPALLDDGSPWMSLVDTGERWDLQSPMERIGELIDAWKAHGGKPWKRAASVPGALTSGVREAIQKLVLSVDNIAPVLDAVAAEMGEDSVHEWHQAGPGAPVTSFRFRNAAQQIEHERRVAAAERAALAAQSPVERAQAEAKRWVEQGAKDRLAAEAQRARFSPVGLETAKKRISEWCQLDEAGKRIESKKISLLSECRALGMGCTPADREAIEQMLLEAGLIGGYGPPPPLPPAAEG